MLHAGKDVSRAKYARHKLAAMLPPEVLAEAEREQGPPPNAAAHTRGGCTSCTTHSLQPFCLSSETVLPIERNRSTYQAKPFYLSSETVLPIE
jgi:hypothetical protein